MSKSNDELESYGANRQKRVRLVAWIVIIALLVTGGGATVLALIFG
jgi:hypothetical protein